MEKQERSRETQDEDQGLSSGKLQRPASANASLDLF